MKIFIVGNYNTGVVLTGPDKFSNRLFYFLVNNRQFNVLFVTIINKKLSRGSLYNRLFGFEELDKQKRICNIGIIRFFFYCFSEKPNIIHVTSGEHRAIFVYFYKMFLRYKVSTTFHGTVKDELVSSKLAIRIKGFLLEKLAVNTSDYLVFVSVLLFDRFKKRYRITKKSIIIENGVDENFRINSPKKFLFTGGIHFVFYNGVDSVINRGSDYIIDAIRSLKTKKIVLHILGNKIEDSLKDENVLLINHGLLNQEDLINLFKNVHFVIKSHTFDSFPVLVIEAMASGVIPIVSDYTGVATYITNGKNGFCYPHKVDNGLINVMVELFKGTHNFEEISKEAVKIYDLLSWDMVLKKYIDLYYDLSERKH
jgi:glycosyltransferase involved in cell wall biosynthesis